MPDQIQRQVDRILDESHHREIEVIVQVEPEKRRSTGLRLATSEAVARRRFSLTPRDLLPAPYSKSKAPKSFRDETKSSKTLLGRAAQESLALAQIKKEGLNSLHPLLQSTLVQKALARMREAEGKDARSKPKAGQLWASRSVPLLLSRDELFNLPKETNEISAIHLNRRLVVPTTRETRALAVETENVLVSSWGLERTKVLAAWGAYGARGKGVRIGLLDTGVDATHPDLEGKIFKWAEFNSLGRLVPGSEAHDTDEHGTHCAGTLVGGNASGRFIGVAPDARLAAALVLDGKNGGTDAQVLAGIDWCLEAGVDVISLSLGGLVLDAETPPTYTEAILSCVEAGVPVVAAIGNSGQQTTGSPGNDLFALSIGATDPNDRVAGFSGGRTHIIYESEHIAPSHLPLPYSKPDLAAPGVAVTSSVPGGDWKSFNGTSMAAPHVAGAIALLLSATSIREKEENVHRAFLIQDLITGSVEDLGEAGQDHRYGFGRLDVLRAIDFARQRGY